MGFLLSHWLITIVTVDKLLPNQPDRHIARRLIMTLVDNSCILLHHIWCELPFQRSFKAIAGTITLSPTEFYEKHMNYA